MQPLTYLHYLAAVRSDIDYVLRESGYLPAQAVAYAHNELALRTDQFPEELTLSVIG